MSDDFDFEIVEAKPGQDEINSPPPPKLERLLRRLREKAGVQYSLPDEQEQEGEQDEQEGDEIKSEPKQSKTQAQPQEDGTDKMDEPESGNTEPSESGGSGNQQKQDLTIHISCGYCGDILGIKKHLEENPDHYVMVEMIEKGGRNDT
jgi:hypothetical protein